MKEKKLKIYLTSWQKRMLKDLTSTKKIGKIKVKDASAIEIIIGKGTCLASYKLPPDGRIIRDDWVLYLTDEQISMLRTELKLKEDVNEINITSDAIRKGTIALY